MFLFLPKCEHLSIINGAVYAEHLAYIWAFYLRYTMYVFLFYFLLAMFPADLKNQMAKQTATPPTASPVQMLPEGIKIIR